MDDLFSWNGGSGSFSDPSQWTDVTNPDQTGTLAPGPADTADFSSGGVVSGSGDVSDLTIEAGVTFAGDITAGDITNSGGITVSSGELDAASNLFNFGLIVVQADLAAGYIGNTGSISVNGGILSSSDFISSDGVINVSSAGDL
jgi:hypothetical protein